MTTQTQTDQATHPTSLAAANVQAPVQRLEAPAPNHTGLPHHLKAGVESLSGLDLSDVRVNYNSTKPAQLQAHAYTQGNQIHVGPGQEQHLAHEAWHVVQQKQGRVAPTMQFKGTNINHDRGLEQEADVMGARAMRFRGTAPAQGTEAKSHATCTTCGAPAGSCGHAPVQAVGWDDWAARLGVGLGALGAGAGFMAAAPAVLAGGATAGALGAAYMAYRRFGPGRNLGDAGEQIAPGDPKLLPLKKHLAKERQRVKHDARPKLGGRNKLAYPLEAAGGAPERTLIFESAGLGGNHPNASGRSIAHTEKQVRAMRRNALHREATGQPPFEIRSPNHTFNLLDQQPKDYMISTNSACTQGSNCAAIHESEVFSRRAGNTMHYMNPYDQGAANNDHVLRDMLMENTNLNAPGETFFISQDDVRGRDFDTISHLSAETVSDVDAADIWDEQRQRFDNS